MEDRGCHAMRWHKPAKYERSDKHAVLRPESALVRPAQRASRTINLQYFGGLAAAALSKLIVKV